MRYLFSLISEGWSMGEIFFGPHRMLWLLNFHEEKQNNIFYWNDLEELIFVLRCSKMELERIKFQQYPQYLINEIR